MLAVLDTDVVVSSLLFRGAASTIHRMILEGRILPLVSPPILDEYALVLAYEIFGLTYPEVKYLIEEEIAPWFELRPIPRDSGHWILEDPSDDKFVRPTRSEPSAVLISGDHHILDRRGDLPCKVLTVQECIDFLG
ncbi:MAG: putative toxin-antitoxin system toxin component, PIN family [Spirochaetaceae bacterium]|nr:putative toxin-antitoxin system toxin component, PIN family [Spirochaetaceae bacterium]